MQKDTDLEIQILCSKSVSDIFLEDGEEFFRIKEKEVLRSCLLGESSILSLGGGAAVSFDAQSALRASGAFIVYLKISLAAVSSRIGFDQSRPLLAVNPRATWLSLMTERAPIYENLADFVIDVDNTNVAEICDEIEVAFELRSRGVNS